MTDQPTNDTGADLPSEQVQSPAEPDVDLFVVSVPVYDVFEGSEPLSPGTVDLVAREESAVGPTSEEEGQ